MDKFVPQELYSTLFRKNFPLRVQLFQFPQDIRLLGGQFLEPGHLGSDFRIGHQPVDFLAPVFPPGEFFLAFL